MAKIKSALEDFRPDVRLLDERGATPERLRRAGDHIHVDDKHVRHLRDSPIERARTRKAINSGQYTAAQKFYIHWYRAGLSESIGSLDLNRVFGTDPSNMVGMARTEDQAFHRQQYRRAVQSVGMKGSMILEAVICRESTLEQVGRMLGWVHKMQATAAATELLREKLDVLCREWGITTETA